MQYQGPHSPHSHNPSVHRKYSSIVTDTSVHRGHPSALTSGDQLRKQRASCPASADSSAHKIPSGPSALCSQPPISAGSVGATDLNPSSSGKLRRRKLQDVEGKGSRRESVPMSGESCSHSGLDRDGSSHSALGTRMGSLPCSASLAKSGSRQGSPGLDDANFFAGRPSVDRVSGRCRPPSQLPDAHVPSGPSLQPEHDSESIMLIAELSDSKFEGFLDEGVRDPNDPESGEHQSSLASMFDEEAVALTGCELAGAIRTGGGAPPNRTTSNEESAKSEGRQHRPIAYRHSISGEIKGHGPGSKHDGISMPVCSHLLVPPSAPSARSLQKSLGSSSKTHRPSRLGTPSPSATPSHSGPQVLPLDAGEQDTRGSGRLSGGPKKEIVLRLPLPCYACHTRSVELLCKGLDHDEADHVMRSSPFKAPQFQEPDLLDPPCNPPDSDAQSLSPTNLRCQNSRLNRPALNLRSLAKAGSINSQGSSQTSPKPVQGCGPALSPKSSGEGLASGLHSLRSLGMAVGSPPKRGPASSNAVDVPGRAQIFNRGSASRDMPASLNQWVAGAATPSTSHAGPPPAGTTCRSIRQQPPSQQPFQSGSPKGFGHPLGSPLVGPRCSSQQELTRDVDEITALSYFSHRGSMTNQRQGSPVGSSTRNPNAGPHSQSASCHGGSAFYSSSAHPAHVRPTSGSVHGGTAFGAPTPKVFSFSHAPLSGSVHGGTAAPMFHKAPVTSPPSSASLSQGTRFGLSSLPSTSPPPTSESSHGGAAFQSRSQAQVNQPKPRVMFASQHGGSLYKDHTDRLQQQLANPHVHTVVGNSSGGGECGIHAAGHREQACRGCERQPRNECCRNALRDLPWSSQEWSPRESALVLQQWPPDSAHLPKPSDPVSSRVAGPSCPAQGRVKLRTGKLESGRYAPLASFARLHTELSRPAATELRDWEKPTHPQPSCWSAKVHTEVLPNYLIEIKFCEDTRPEHQLNAAKQQHAELCKLINAKAVTIHPILLG
ncbi:hypothetical protein DUNSADRAFT_12407 [Dunaliella salina]|uniref:Uncharacterized protein n=1 Tax=Dunaliella salina TaxID=3046 RepID=A0ABQ7GBC0_DUNSA|nr:hypothetical protein DUNSADRAFT_12407 [Dunaliella salina]|eukprot:KAF5831896.1 hypothetical protein DUNSADRAFT_12407 [Dunaliella salina]